MAEPRQTWPPAGGPLMLATSNRHKAAEFARLLARCRELARVELLSMGEARPALVLSEEAETLAENARGKAEQAARAAGLWTLADDTGLFVTGLGGAPGVRSARYAGPEATAEQNRTRLLQAIAELPVEGREAEFRCHLAIADPAGRIVAESQGLCRGRLLLAPRGGGGFGYDSLLELPEYRLTLAELGPAATDAIGHRGRAVRALDCQLGS